MTTSNKNLISTTRRVIRETEPRLYNLFRTAMKRLKPKCRISLRIGDVSDYACAVHKTKDRAHTVYVSEYAINVLNTQELLFLLGHEIGHVILWTPPAVSIDEDMDSLLPDLSGCHPDITKIVNDTYIEMFADMLGVSVVEDVEVAVSALNKLCFGEFSRKSLEHPDSNVSLVEHAELEMQMKILRLMAKSEIFYDAIDMPLFKTGRKLLSEDEFYRRVKQMFKPWMQISNDEHDALLECCYASLHILLREEGGGLKGLWEYFKTYLGNNFRPEKISRFTSIDEAYLKIQELSPVLKGMDHFLKFRLFGDIIVYAAFETESDPYVAEDFVREIGGTFGFSLSEIREYLSKYHHRFEMKKAG